MTDQTKPDPVLPPLPAPGASDPGRFGAMWTGDQMQAYGRACYAQARADLIAELRPVAGFFKDEDGVRFTSRSGAPHTKRWVELAIIPEK